MLIVWFELAVAIVAAEGRVLLGTTVLDTAELETGLGVETGLATDAVALIGAALVIGGVGAGMADDGVIMILGALVAAVLMLSLIAQMRESKSV